jgi:hypothetical protein
MQKGMAAAEEEAARAAAEDPLDLKERRRQLQARDVRTMKELADLREIDIFLAPPVDSTGSPPAIVATPGPRRCPTTEACAAWLGRMGEGVTVLASREVEGELEVDVILSDATHKAKTPVGGFRLGSWLAQGQAGTAWHGTDLESFAGVLACGGGLTIGPNGNPAGVYHSEERSTARGYCLQRPTRNGPNFVCHACQGVLLQLQGSDLMWYSKDPVSGRNVGVPDDGSWPNGAKIGRWKQTNGRHQSVSWPHQVEIAKATIFFVQELAEGTTA